MERNIDCWYNEVCLAEDGACHGCIKFMEMSHLMEHSNLPKAKQKPIRLTAPDEDLETYEKLASIKDNIVEFVEMGRNLYIGSETTGNGKTSWAVKLMLRYFDQIWAGNGFRTRALFIHVPTFLLRCKDFDNKDASFEQLKKDILSVDLVVWDDIGGISISQYDYTQLLMYIEARTFAEKSNIFTSNCNTYEKLQDMVSSKLASRIWTTDAEIIIFKGGDRR